MVDRDGQNAYYYACAAGNMDCAEFLKANGCPEQFVSAAVTMADVQHMQATMIQEQQANLSQQTLAMVLQNQQLSAQQQAAAMMAQTQTANAGATGATATMPRRKAPPPQPSNRADQLVKQQTAAVRERDKEAFDRLPQSII